MNVRWATDYKAKAASEKHFMGAFNAEEMTAIVRLLLKKASLVGRSDRANPGYTPATIVWAENEGTTFCIILDTEDLKKDIATVVSFYDVVPSQYEHKAKRFNMKRMK